MGFDRSCSCLCYIYIWTKIHCMPFTSVVCDMTCSPSTENKHVSNYSSHGSSGSSSASGNTQQRPPSGNSNANNRGNGAVHPYPPRIRHSTSLSSCSEFTSVSQQPPPGMQPDRISIHSGSVKPGNLGVPANLANSRESFQQALDNPCEYFIDVM